MAIWFDFIWFDVCSWNVVFQKLFEKFSNAFDTSFSFTPPLTSPTSISLYKGVRMSIETLLLTIESVTIEQNPSAQSDQLIELWYVTQTVIKRNPAEWNATLWKDGLEMSTTNCLEKLQRDERVVRSISVSGSRQIFDFVPEITLQSKECIQSPILYCKV